MKHEFKPGDPALVIGIGSKNNFRAVELIAHLGAPATVLVEGHEFHNNDRDDLWLVRSLGDPLIPARKVRKALGIGPLVEVPIATRKLMPLRGDEHDDLITTERPAELVGA